MVEITEVRHEELLDCELKLSALEQGGVDNWDWYGEAMSTYWEMKDEDNE